MAQAEETKIYDVDAKKFYEAVTSYEKYPEFVEGMRKVTLERAPGAKEFVGHYELSMMGKDMSYTLNVSENPEAGIVSWTLKSSEFFKVNTGKWTIKSLGAGKCEATYNLEVEFNFSVPGFILKGIIKGTLPTMMGGFYERARKL